MKKAIRITLNALILALALSLLAATLIACDAPDGKTDGKTDVTGTQSVASAPDGNVTDAHDSGEVSASTEGQTDTNALDGAESTEVKTETDASDGGQETKKSDRYSPAPDFTVLDSSGEPVRLSDYRGRPIVLNFWATWCGYCLYEMPDFNEAYHNYPDVMFMMVNYTDGFYETVESATNCIESEGFDFEIFFDTEIDAISAYGVRSYPVTFFIDADGYLITYSPGMLNYSTLEQGIKMITEEN